MVSFHQILKKGQNIKIDIWKCPIKVELVKKSSYRAGTLQMPFQIHSNLCAIGTSFKYYLGNKDYSKKLVETQGHQK